MKYENDNQAKDYLYSLGFYEVITVEVQYGGNKLFTGNFEGGRYDIKINGENDIIIPPEVLTKMEKKDKEEDQKQMVFKKDWKEFRDSGLLWWINTMLHMFGWAIVVQMEDDGTISDAYPARVKFRGFGEESITNGYRNVTKFLKENIDELQKEAEEE